MNKRYFRITYGEPGYRSAKEAIVSVINDNSATDVMAKAAIAKLHDELGENVRILRYNKLPSNYKAGDANIIE